MSFMTAPTNLLNEIAQGTIKTQWGQYMKMENPEQGEDKVYNRLEKKYGHNVAAAFTDVAPILAERLAIAEYKAKKPNSQLEMIAPELNTYQEALETVSTDRRLTMDEAQKVLNLLKTDQSMKAVNVAQ